MNEWVVKTISDCCDILDNRRIPINFEEREKRIGDIPYYGANGIQGYINDYIFDDNLILLAEDGGYFDEYSTRPIAYKISGKSWVNNHAHVLKAKNGFKQDYIFYSLVHKNILPFIVGGTRSKLNQTELKSVTINFPSTYTEQTKIAEILSTVDKAIEQTEAIIAKQQRIKTGLMQDLLTKGIDENGNIRSEETHEFKDSPLGRIPVEWDIEQLKNCVEPNAPICYGILMPGEFYENGIPVIKVKDIIDGRILIQNLLLTDPRIEKQYKRSRLVTNDLLLTIRGTTGRIALVPEELTGANITQDTARIRMRREFHIPYIYILLQSKNIQVQIKLHTLGQAVKGINIVEVKKIKISFPYHDEQIRIAKVTNIINKDINYQRDLKKKLISIKTGLMQDLLTGKVRVTELLKQE